MNSRRLIRAWGSNEKPIIKSKISSNLDLAGLSKKEQNTDKKDLKDFILQLAPRENIGYESDEDEYEDPLTDIDEINNAGYESDEDEYEDPLTDIVEINNAGHESDEDEYEDH